MLSWQAIFNDNTGVNIVKQDQIFEIRDDDVGVYSLQLPNQLNKNGYFNLTAEFKAPNAPNSIRCEIKYHNGINSNQQKFTGPCTIILGYEYKEILIPGKTVSCDNIRTMLLNGGFSNY